jgi:hypothetical protein
VLHLLLLKAGGVGGVGSRGLLGGSLLGGSLLRRGSCSHQLKSDKTFKSPD